jgi:putative membrane protein
MWGAGWGYWGWGWWFWVFWAVIVFLFLWILATSLGRGGREIPPEEQILRERYARGEISREEFERRVNDLRRAA